MSQLAVEVHDTTVNSRSGETKAGKPWELHEQTAWIRFLGHPYPTMITVGIENPKKPLQKGLYALDPARCLKVGNFNSLQLDDRLVESALQFKGEIKDKAAV